MKKKERGRTVIKHLVYARHYAKYLIFHLILKKNLSAVLFFCQLRKLKLRD